MERFTHEQEVVPQDAQQEENPPVVIQGKRPDEYIESLKKAGLEKHAAVFAVIVAVARIIQERGGRAMLVGGAVRDELTDKHPNDFDIEVYNVDEGELKKILEGIGEVEECGQVYGIFKVRIEGISVDFSLPRKERSTGDTHKDIEVESAPDLSFRQAAQRRDFTINAFLKDVLTGEIFDYFGGIDDLRQRRLRMVSERTFAEDPLRPMRAPQFVGRFGFFVDHATQEEIKKVTQKLATLPVSRLRDEWKKLLTRSKTPSLGLSAAMGLGILETLYGDEVLPLTHTEQDPHKHPEGNVWIHTMQAVDSARRVIDALNKNHRQGRQDGMSIESEEELVILLATFCHDFGKPKATKKEEGKITSYEHEQMGLEPAAAFLEKIGTKKKVIDKVLKIVRCHRRALDMMKAFQDGKVSSRMIRRLVQDVFPASVKELLVVAVADSMGRVGLPNVMKAQLLDVKELRAIQALSDLAQQEVGEHNRPKQAIAGQELIALGIEPRARSDAEFGQLLSLVNALVDHHGIEKAWVISELEKQKGKPLRVVAEYLQRRFKKEKPKK